MEASRLTEGAQTSLQAVSSEGGLQAIGSVGPHAERLLPTAPSDEMPDQDSRRELGRREPPPQIGQDFLRALARVGLEVGVRPALQALRRQGFQTNSRQMARACALPVTDVQCIGCEMGGMAAAACHSMYGACRTCACKVARTVGANGFVKKNRGGMHGSGEDAIHPFRRPT